MSGDLPIEEVREEALELLGRGALVLTAETGSGKSTQVPRWLASTGRVLVVEPRRVACRSLARYVSELEESPLGERVGYVHRHDERRGEGTRILFVTPGVAIRMIAGGDLGGFDHVILDEFHERSMEMDLLLALLARKDPGRLVVMSATIEVEPLTRFLDGSSLHAAGRIHPVEVEYTGCSLLPSDRDLAGRVRRAVEAALRYEGDLLVFLPGAREIAEAVAACRGLAGLECLPLHGSLPAGDQDRAFRPGPERRAVFATNVAETSVTLPRIGVVVDSGLVRRTLYRWGAASLGLVPVARDSAEQRRGRAGRLGPGHCIRLWEEAGILEARTPPELHREPLDDLVLRAGECGVRLDRLRMLDPPQPYALDHALEELRHLGAVDEAGEVTERGRRLARHPLPPLLAALLEECTGTDQVQDAVDLVAALGGPPWSVPSEAREDLGEEHCDAALLIRALRRGDGVFGGKPPHGFQEARRSARRLRKRLGLDEPSADAPVDRLGLARRALSAHPRMAFVRRTRSRLPAFTNGGSEVLPDRRSALEEDAQSMVVLGIRAREGRRGTELLATCCLPVPLPFLAELGLGRRRLAGVDLVKGKLEAGWETVYAGRVLTREEGEPAGALLHEAVADLTLRGRLFPGVRDRIEERLADVCLQRQLDGEDPGESRAREWLTARLQELGVHGRGDLALLEDEDLLPEALDDWSKKQLDERFPRRLRLPDGVFQVVYLVSERKVVLVAPKGVKKNPASRDLPRWEGWKVYCRIKNRETRVSA